MAATGTPTLWQRVQSHPAVSQLYDQLKDPSSIPYFPIAIRHIFDEWLEAQPWHRINPDDPAHIANAKLYVNLLFKQITEKVNDLTLSPNQDSFLLKLRLEEIASVFQTLYAENPNELVRVVQHCLQQEQEILNSGRLQSFSMVSSSSMSSASYGMDMQNLNDATLNAEIQRVQESVQNTEALLAEVLQRQEHLVFQYQEYDEVSEALTTRAGELTEVQRRQLVAHREQTEAWIANEGQTIMTWRRKILEEHVATIQLSERVLRVLLSKLKQWKAAQRKCTAEPSFIEDMLNHMQLQFETMATIYQTLRHQLRQHEVQREQLRVGDDTEALGVLEELNRLLHEQMETLIRASFVVVKQPPQVMKTSTKFPSIVRVLIGSRLNMHMNPPEVTVQIINQAQALELMQNDRLVGNSGDLLNGKQMMAYSEQGRTLQATFKNLSLKKIRRRTSKKDDVVTEEKFALVFVTTLQMGELTFTIWALSIPCVVIVHVNQTIKATATVFWDNSFGRTEREPWAVPSAMRWPKFANGLNHFFSLINGRPLSADGLNYLGSKLLGAGEDMVSWERFNREPLRGRDFTFWEWFYAITELVRKGLSEPWNDGSIIGFIPRTQASALLASCPKGTFLMRFSDSELGGISVSWTVVDQQGNTKVWNLQPWFEKDLIIRSLSDRLRDLQQLVTLYPNIPKNDAFGKYYSDAGVDVEGDYVRTTLRAATVNQPGQSHPETSMLAHPANLAVHLAAPSGGFGHGFPPHHTMAPMGIGPDNSLVFNSDMQGMMSDVADSIISSGGVGFDSLLSGDYGSTGTSTAPAGGIWGSSGPGGPMPMTTSTTPAAQGGQGSLFPNPVNPLSMTSLGGVPPLADATHPGTFGSGGPEMMMASDDFAGFMNQPSYNSIDISDLLSVDMAPAPNS